MSTTMMVTIPQGTAPNAVLQVRAPDGRTIKVRVPRNMRPGQQMRISVPTADVDPASEAGDRDARRRQREEAARYRQAAAARDRAPTRSAAVKAAVKAAKVPANPSRGRLPVAGLVGKSFGLYQKDQKAWLALDETKRLVKIDVGHRFSRKSAMKLCEERGGRLAYRREVVDEKSLGATPKLRVNGGKAFGGNKWTPVLDGNPNRATDGIGWVQIGDPKRLGKNHREANQSDCAWGGQGHHMGHKGPWIWCVKEGPHGPFLVKINVGHTFTRTSAQQLCRERGGRLAYRRELVDEATLMPQLLVNDGKAFGGDKRAPVSLMIVAWIPVLDGDPNKNNDGMGWVQIGDPGRLGKNHKEAHGADCTWGDISQAPHWKGPWIYCVVDEAVTTKTGPWAGWDTARFVAFDDAGNNRVAFRNPGTKRWLRVTPDGVTDAPAHGNWNAIWQWERFELHELAGGVGLRSTSGRWLTIGGKRTIELEEQGAWNADEIAAAEKKKLAEEMERAAAADRAEAERRAKELAAERERMTTAPEEPEPEAVAPELPAAASDEFARIDCDSPRVVLGGESELSARIDALFRVRRSPALAAQLNKIYEHHDGIPRYTT